MFPEPIRQAVSEDGRLCLLWTFYTSRGMAWLFQRLRGDEELTEAEVRACVWTARELEFCRRGPWQIMVRERRPV